MAIEMVHCHFMIMILIILSNFNEITLMNLNKIHYNLGWYCHLFSETLDWDFLGKLHITSQRLNGMPTAYEYRQDFVFLYSSPRLEELI